MSYRVIDKQVLYKGRKVRLEVHHVEDQETGRRLQREVIVHPGAVVVLPLLANEQVLLIRNRRHTVGQQLIELPAGTLEKQEDPMNCAGRELLEETGYLAARMRPLTSFFTSPGILTEKMYAFVAYDLEKSHAASEEGEEIEVLPTHWDEAIEMIADGRIIDGKTIATLLYYKTFSPAGAGSNTEDNP